MNRDLFRKAVRWFGMLILAHFVGMLIFGMLFANSVAILTEESNPTAIWIVVIYNAVFDALFVAFCLKFKLSYDNKDRWREIRQSVKANTFSVINYFKTEMLKEHLVKTGVFALFQLPLVIFTSFFGLSMLYPTTLEQFYIMDAGCYMFAPISLLGWLLNTLLFSAVFTSVVLMYLLIIKKDAKKNIID